MPPLLLIIRNLCLQGKAPDEVIQNIDDVNEVLTEALEELRR
jgi:predicted RNase H-like HicB family nuclease